ncbi:MAG: molybdenum ABC transporter ATP-binding protein [Rhodospirillales bacterium]
MNAAMNAIVVDVALRLDEFVLQADLRLPGNGVTVLFGSSGAGKTSLINCIAGLVTPQRGRIAIGERVLFDAQAGIDLPPERRHVGYVFQDGRLFPHLTVASNLRYGVKHGSGAVAFDEVVELLGIGALLKRRPLTLSGGEKQRVAIGRALLSSPQLLLMDEPLASLDAARRAEILPYLERLRDHFALPIVYVTHDRAEAQRLAAHVVLIRTGQVVQQGAPAEVLPAVLLADQG